MPLYICYCPDYPNALDKRSANRPDHLAMGKKSAEAGEKVFGRAFLSADHAHSSSTSSSQPSAGADHPGMSGSVMIYRYSTLEKAWARIKSDPYWSGGVWDKEKAVVRELLEAPGDETMKVV